MTVSKEIDEDSPSGKAKKPLEAVSDSDLVGTSKKEIADEYKKLLHEDHCDLRV